MGSDFRVKNFKRITKEICLEDLQNVNYFVGENGCGKSSILNSLSYLNDDTNARIFFSNESVTKLTINNKFKQLRWEDTRTNNTFNEGDLVLKIFIPDEIGEKGANGVTKYQSDYSNLHKERVEYLNRTLELLDLPVIAAKRIIDNDDPWSDHVGKRVFIQNEKEIEIKYMAKGIRAMNDLRMRLDAVVKKYSPSESEPDAFIVILEEPENYLHPSLQKKIPIIINEFLLQVGEERRNKIFFFIATHSPFIIGASGEFGNQKTYLIKEGKLCDLHLKPLSNSKGYSGRECAWVVGQMLGADISDLGYPLNYCILEEYSLQVILENAKGKKIIRDYEFVSASGISNVGVLSDTISSLSHLNTLMKCNPYYADKYMVIVDNVSTMPDKVKNRIEQLSKKLGGRFIELSKPGLEDYYSNIDPKIFDEYLSEASNAGQMQKGIVKSSFAVKIAEQIKSRQDFSKLFDGELDILLA